MRKDQPLGIPRNGLVWEWILDGNALDTNDGIKSNGTATNMTWVSTERGYQKQAGNYSGTASIVVPYLAQYNSSDISSFAWVYFPVLSHTTNHLVMCRDNVSAAQRTWQYSITQAGGIFNAVLWNTSDTLFSFQHSTALVAGRYYMVGITAGGGSLKLYIDWREVSGGGSYTGSLKTSTNPIGIWATSPWTANYKGILQSARLYNRVLSEQEIQQLYLEWLRQLGAGSDSVLASVVAQFENFGDNNITNITSGILATRTGWTSTNDNFWLSKAITNPNYTWASITYTNAYSFENSWSGWGLVSWPSGVSATGINRTTTLRSLFLTSRALTSAEQTELDLLCKTKYVYPFKKTLPLNLNSNVLSFWACDTSGTTFYDINLLNNGTMTNSPTITRIWQHKQIDLNGSNQYVSVPHASSLNLWISDFTISFTANIRTLNTNAEILTKLSTAGTETWIYIAINWSTTEIQLVLFNSSTNSVLLTWTNFIETNKNVMMTFVRETVWWVTTLYAYKNRTLFKSASITNRDINNTANLHIWTTSPTPTRYTNGKLSNIAIFGKALSQYEIQQLYYSTFIS